MEIITHLVTFYARTAQEITTAVNQLPDEVCAQWHPLTETPALSSDLSNAAHTKVRDKIFAQTFAFNETGIQRFDAAMTSADNISYVLTNKEIPHISCIDSSRARGWRSAFARRIILESKPAQLTRG